MTDDLIERLRARAEFEDARVPKEVMCDGFELVACTGSEYGRMLREAADALEAAREDAERLDFIERTYSGMTNRERYLPVQMIWGKGCNGRTLREACDKYMEREARNG